MNMKKILAFALCLVLVAGLSIGGTLAWITTKTESVVNTFTYGNINITLKESDNLDLTMVPGDTLKKDPIATVLKGSEASYLFVKLEKSANFDNFLTYEMADGWIALDDQAGVFYREVADLTAENAENAAYSVLKGDEVKVLNTVTKSAFEKLTADTYPTLTITAYAVQKANVADATTAWTYTAQ